MTFRPQPRSPRAAALASGYSARDLPECRLRLRQPGGGGPSGGVLFANWYADHGVAVGSVGGVAISKDAVRAEAAVMQARYDRVLTDYDTLRNEGQLSTTDYGR